MTDHQDVLQPIEFCRSCRDEREYGEPGIPADVIVWGKLFPPNALGPRCLNHYYAETNARHLDGYAVLDLRRLTRG